MFEVDWLPDAERSLAAIWLAARDRETLSDAADRADKLLRASPETAGESRSAGRRILFADPLGLIYRVVPDRKRVVVSHVWRFR